MERARLRAAIKNLRRAFGSYSCMAAVVGVSAHSLAHAASTTKVSYAYPVVIARAVGMTVEQLIGPPVVADVCPVCGTRRAS